MRASVPFCLSPSAPLHRLDKRAAYFWGATLLVLGAALMSASASAQTASASSLDTTGNFKSEVAACAERATPQARQICIGEARTAQAAKRAGKLENYGANFEANAFKRCEVFKLADDRSACEARVKGATMDASVIDGGVLRESSVTITIPGYTREAPMPMQEPMPTPPSAPQ